MKKINCVYVSNKYMLREIDLRDTFNGYFYFDTNEFVQRISKFDKTNKELNVDAVNASIYRKVQRALLENDFKMIFYVFRNLERGVIEDIKKMVESINGKYYDFNFFISKNDTKLLIDIPNYIFQLFDNLIIHDFDYKVNHNYSLNEGIDSIEVDKILSQYNEG